MHFKSVTKSEILSLPFNCNCLYAHFRNICTTIDSACYCATLIIKGSLTTRISQYSCHYSMWAQCN